MSEKISWKQFIKLAETLGYDPDTPSVDVEALLVWLRDLGFLNSAKIVLDDKSEKSNG